MLATYVLLIGYSKGLGWNIILVISILTVLINLPTVVLWGTKESSHLFIQPSFLFLSEALS